MYRRYFKRIIDIILSIIFLILLSPLFLIIAILIKLDSEGRVFFKQERLGRNGRVFKIIKFRTMIKNAEKIGTGLSTYEWDPRVTRVGKILRKYSLDELPQLLNILKGDMSIIGPRPPVPYHPKKYSEYTDNEKRRFLIKPGVTGYAQVKGRNSLTWEERIRYDILYEKNLSFKLDLKIFFKTIIKVLQSKDIHGPERRIKR